MTLRTTYTYALLDVSPAVFAEVKAKLEAAGYQHADGQPVIDMHGIALVSQPVTECVHGESLEGLCNACSDRHGYGKRETAAGLIDGRTKVDQRSDAL